MKIALVILHGDPTRGGAERYTIDLASALADRGHDVNLLASSFASDYSLPRQTTSLAAPQQRTTDNGPRTIPRILLSASGPTRAGRYVRFLDALDSRLAATPYDIVHAMLPVRRCDVYHPHAGCAAEALARGHLKHDQPFIRAASGVANRLNRRRRLFAAVERQLLNAPHPPGVLCLSNYVKSVFGQWYDLPDDKLPTLFNAVDLGRFDPAQRPDAGREVRARFAIAPEKIVGLMIAQDFARKGLRQAIAAMADAQDPRLVLLVVGKQSHAAYQRLAAGLGVGDRVIFAGATADPYAFYRAADFFVLPTRHDPCSLVVLEALAMGVPVISTVFNGACEIMTDGEHGFVLNDAADVASLAAAMRRLLDPNLRGTMARACLELRPSLSYQRHLDRLLEIYQRISPA